jgi:hypothetical protein
MAFDDYEMKHKMATTGQPNVMGFLSSLMSQLWHVTQFLNGNNYFQAAEKMAQVIYKCQEDTSSEKTINLIQDEIDYFMKWYRGRSIMEFIMPIELKVRHGSDGLNFSDGTTKRNDINLRERMLGNIFDYSKARIAGHPTLMALQKWTQESYKGDDIDPNISVTPTVICQGYIEKTFYCCHLDPVTMKCKLKKEVGDIRKTRNDSGELTCNYCDDKIINMEEDDQIISEIYMPNWKELFNEVYEHIMPAIFRIANRIEDKIEKIIEQTRGQKVREEIERAIGQQTQTLNIAEMSERGSRMNRLEKTRAEQGKAPISPGTESMSFDEKITREKDDGYDDDHD